MATLEFALKFVTNSENAFATASLSQHPNHVGASCRIRTNDPEITNHVLWPTELKRQRHLCAVTVVKRVQMYGFFLNYKTFSTFFSKNRQKISFFPSKSSQKLEKPIRKSRLSSTAFRTSTAHLRCKDSERRAENKTSPFVFYPEPHPIFEV